MEQVFQKFRQELPEIEQYIQKYVPEQTLQKLELTGEESVRNRRIRNGMHRSKRRSGSWIMHSSMGIMWWQKETTIR